MAVVNMLGSWKVFGLVYHLIGRHTVMGDGAAVRTIVFFHALPCHINHLTGFAWGDCWAVLGSTSRRKQCPSRVSNLLEAALQDALEGIPPSQGIL